eukprot:5178169-Ditylum_brightwellii.AAC.1
MAHGCTLICPEQKISAKANADMFVDNATLLHNLLVFHTTAIQLMQQIKHDSELWGGLVWTTGGLLKFRKSTYFLVIWMFTSAGAPSITKEGDLLQNQVKLQGTNGNITPLQRVSPYDSIKMLGVHKAATLDSPIEFNNMHNKLKVFTCALSACPLQQHKVWLRYTTIYLPSIMYLLSTTSFTSKQTDRLHLSLNPRLLPQLGYQRNFSKA